MLIGIDASRAYEPNKTGTENYSFQIIKNLINQNNSKKHRFILYVRSGYQKNTVPRQENVEIVEINWSRLWTQGGLAYETWRREMDVLFVPAHTLPILRKPGIKTVVTIHGLEYEWLPEYKNILQRWYLPLSTKYASKRADRLIAVSGFTGNQLTKRFKINPGKIIVISEGVDKKYFEEKRSRAEISRVFKKYGVDGEYIFFVGTIMPRKNLAFMIRVYSRVLEQFPDIKFVIAGSRGWLYDDVLSEISRNKLDNKVKMIGRISDDELAVLMSQARAYVQPSITEGFGLPVLEAMASGTPVISSNGGALPEIVGEAGLVIEGFDEEDWADSIVKLMHDSTLTQKLITLGKKRSGEYSWDRAGKETLKLIENIE